MIESKHADAVTAARKRMEKSGKIFAMTVLVVVTTALYHWLQ